MAGGDVIALLSKRARRAGRQAGPVRATRARGLRGRGGQVDPVGQGDGAAIGDHQPGGVMDQKRHRRRPGAAGPQRPGVKWVIGRPAEGKEGPPPEPFRKPGQDTRRPAVDGIGRAIPPFRFDGQVRPEAGFIGAEQKQGAGAVGQAVAGFGMERPEHREAMRGGGRGDR